MTAPIPLSDDNRRVADVASVERLFREHNAALLRFISAKVGSDQEAREIAQEAYVHLLRLSNTGAISYLRAFLFKTAANLAVDRLRQRNRRSHIDAAEKADFAIFELTPERQVCGIQAMTVIQSAISELPPKCRQTFVSHRFDGLPIADIARLLGIGECMARRYVARAIEHIRRRLDNAGYSISGDSR